MATGKQLDWSDFFRREDTQNAVREKLINELPIPDPAKELLICLDGLAREMLAKGRRGAVIHPDGTVEVTIPIDVLAWNAGKSENTVRGWIDLAEQTPFFGGIRRKHRPHTFLVRWQQIVDRDEPVVRTTVEQCEPARAAKGGVQRGVQSGVQRGVQKGVQRGVQPPVLKPPEVSEALKFKNLQTSNLRGADAPLASKVRPPGFWPRWRAAVKAHNLSTPADVDELFRLAVTLSEGTFAASEDNRFQVFCQAAKATRPGGADYPKSLFASNVGNERWFKVDADEDEARRMMAELQGRPKATREEQYIGQLQADAEAAENRLRMIAQLNSMKNNLAARMGAGAK